MDVREKLVEFLCKMISPTITVGEQADFLIANGVTVQEWISVKDRLPDLELSEAKANDADLYPCLVVIKHQRAKGGRFVSKCWYNGYDFLDADSCPWTFETTHWMPMPEAPKGE